jgi:hypothetical protein
MVAAIDTTVMATLRERWAKQQADFLAKWEATHDFDFCPLHGFWRLGQKNGGFQILTCPACPTQEVVERLIWGEEQVS